ncbi:alcohol dehydrogenase [Mycena vulgaris]|nr:alcohol dehydrogenase [Mycena vulgaris]
MAPITNGRVLFNSVPKDFPIPGETTVYDTAQTIDIDSHPLNGGFLVKTLVLSIDPYLRGRMTSPEKKSYMPAFTLGEPITGFGVGLVVRSDNLDVAPGKYIYGMAFHHQEYFVLPDMTGFIFLEKNPKLPWSVYVGAAGMPGKTAYFGWKEYSHAKKGEIAFITTGAGSLNSNVSFLPTDLTKTPRRTRWLVRICSRRIKRFFFHSFALSARFAIQLAKRDGLKVIASAGSDEKVKFMLSIGADVAFNYKTTDTREVLAREGPIDMYVFFLAAGRAEFYDPSYWDNVGGEVLDAALEYAAVYARFIECGNISGYNTGYQGVKNINLTYAKSLTISGLAVFRLTKYEEEFYATVPQALANGDIKYSEDVSYGLDKVGDVLLAVQTGANKAKAVVVVAEE